MSRPATKPDLLEAAAEQFDQMWKLIDAMPEEEQKATFHFDDSFVQKEAHWERDRNLRDVLAHLYEWHQLLLNWIASNRNGEPKPFLPEPYNWKSYGQMNVGFWKKHQLTPLADLCGMLKESHADVIKTINDFSNEELFTKKIFSWTGTTTLGSYMVSASSSHYDWAIKKIKAHRKTYCRYK